tara:strand:+ start:19666 stop:20004 length:339 start_codon:yes stop_codon:yes gene_type:complete
MNIIILNRNPFCLWKDKEVGIAEGYFAGTKFSETSGNEYITEVMGHAFGWYDNEGDYYKEDKYHMTRPTDEQIIEALLKYPQLRKIAFKMELIDISNHIIVKGPPADKVWMN